MEPDEIRHVGHELANALTAVAGSLDVLQSVLQESGTRESLELVAEARKACERATQLTRRLAAGARDAEAAEADSGAAPPPPAGEPGACTILLCEDVDSIRRSTRMVLRSHGYHVLDAATASEAEEQAAQAPKIDLLVADIELADGDGPSLAAALVAQRPELLVLYVSGHAAGTVQLPPAAPKGRYLEKPFSSDTLLRKVREILGSRPA